MMRLTTVCGIAVMMAAAGCAGDDTMSPDDGGAPPPGGGGVSGDVSVRNDFFDPADVTRGTGTVVWAWNSGGRGHNVTFEDGIGNSTTQGSGTHSRTFSAAGTFRYRCTIHSSDFNSGMVGSVEVQ